MLQLLHTNDPFAATVIRRKRRIVTGAGLCMKHFVPRVRSWPRSRGRGGEEASVYIYVGTSNLAMADRGAAHLRDSRRGMQGTFDGSHMARHALEMHPGEEPKFGMTIVKTYNSTFTRAMGEVVRILYRSKEKGVVLLNSKAGDFASYSLPRLSVQNWEEDQEGPSNRSRSKNVNRDESNRVDSSDLGSKTKVKLKPPCLNINMVKTKPVRGENRNPGN